MSVRLVTLTDQVMCNKCGFISVLLDLFGAIFWLLTAKCAAILITLYKFHFLVNCIDLSIIIFILIDAKSNHYKQNYENVRNCMKEVSLIAYKLLAHLWLHKVQNW